MKPMAGRAHRTAGICQVVLAEGAVHVLRAVGATAPLALSVADVEIAFGAAVGPPRGVPFRAEIPLDPEALAAGALPERPTDPSGQGSDRSSDPTGGRAAGLPGGRLRCTDLAGGQGGAPTGVVVDLSRLADIDRAVGALHLRAETALPAGADGHVLRLDVGLGGAAADLRIHLTPADGGQADTLTLPLEPTAPATAPPTAARSLEIPLPPARTGTRLRLSVHLAGPVAEMPDGAGPWLALAGAEVRAAAALPAGPQALHLTGPAPPGATWLTARFPVAAFEDGSLLELVAGDRRIPLMRTTPAPVRVERRTSDRLSLLAAVPGRCALYLDGAFREMLEIGSEPCEVCLPGELLLGVPVHVGLRDATGSRLLFETHLPASYLPTPADVLQREGRPPFPGALFAQAAHRYEALKRQLARGPAAPAPEELAHALESLEAGPGNLHLAPFAFPTVEAPEVSVVIPAHNALPVTYGALCALLLAPNATSFEVVLVDDGSTDGTAEIETLVGGLTVVRNATPRRFIEACTAGVAAARGRYICLLNNDTEVTAGWLDALVDAFSRFDRVGLAGARLLFPDGRLQDAGGIVWRSGDPWNYGRGDSPWDPRFSYSRQADYLSGAALMVPRAVWDEVGGFSDYLAPMYFEDTDLAFKVRAAGYTTWYVPSAIVYHHEGATSGTDAATGAKAFQEANRPKFKARWAEACRDHAVLGDRPDLEKDRGIDLRVLFINHTTPRPDRDAGGHAAVEEMRLVQGLGHKVSFLPENLTHIGAHTEALQRNGIEVIHAPFARSVTEFLERRGEEFDVVYVTRYHVARRFIETLGRTAPRAKIVLNLADLHFLRALRAAAVSGDPSAMSEALEVREAELAVIGEVDLVLSYSEAERAAIASHAPRTPMAACPWVVTPVSSTAPLAGRAGLSFLGGFRHPPNIEGVRWFAETVMSRLARQAPELTLSIYGSAMGPEVTALETSNVHPVGYAERLADAFDPHRCFVAPLLSGAGIKGKVLAAMAHGVPCVLSPLAAEGTGARHGQECLIAATPAEWVVAILSLERDDALWQRLATGARALIETEFGPARGLERMRAAFAMLDTGDRPPECPICGGTEFREGPGGRRYRDLLPACKTCGALERHRVFREILGRLGGRRFAGSSALDIGGEMSFDRAWFASIDSRAHGRDGFDLQAMALPDGARDVIVCCDALTRVADDAAALGELARVVSARGLVFLSMPNPVERQVTRDWGFADPKMNGQFRTYGRDVAERLRAVLPGIHTVAVTGTDPVTGRREMAYVLSHGAAWADRAAELRLTCELVNRPD